MIRRLAALFALFAFAIAWIAGVFFGFSPLTRLQNAGLALVAGFVTGLGVGLALERIVLSRMAEEWRPPTAKDEAATTKAPAAGAAARGGGDVKRATAGAAATPAEATR